jgi:hypothetical protein
MKKKIHKILGISLALVFAFSLSFSLTTPAMADEESWSIFDVPQVAGASDFFMDTTISGLGPFVRAIDGTFYLYMDNTVAATADLYKSDDGIVWEATDYNTDLAAAADDPVGIAVSTEDADVLYVASATNVYKTEDGGDSWEDLGAPGTGAATEVLTCIAVGYANDDPHLFVGSVDPGVDGVANNADDAALNGEVYYYQDAPFASVWTELDVVGPDNGGVINDSEVFGIACSPDFANDTLTVAVIFDDTTNESYVTANTGAGIGATEWDDVELLNDAAVPVSFTITEATDPVFVEDFDIDDDFEYFVGVQGPAHAATNGGVYRVTGMAETDDFLLDDIDDDIASLDLVGNLGGTSLVAGTNGTAAAVGPGSIWYSTDDGDSWDETDKAPTGEGATQCLVIVDDDFATRVKPGVLLTQLQEKAEYTILLTSGRPGTASPC